MSAIKVDTSAVAQAKSDLIGIRNGFKRAYARALNRTTTGVRTDIVNLIRTDYNLKAGDIRKRLHINKATWGNLEAKVVSKGRDIFLSEVSRTSQNKQGLRVNVKKSTGSKVIPHGFLRVPKSGGKKLSLIRVRRGGSLVKRYPLKVLYAPAPEKIYNTPSNWMRIERGASDRLAQNVKHETNFVLGRFSNG